MNLKPWGNYPIIKNKVSLFKNEIQLKKLLNNNDTFISYGNGRSYGDSAMAKNIIHTKEYNFFINFDCRNGILECMSGVLLSEIIETFVPRGWFITIAPGTKFVTVGGAIASDIHGKNHHISGSFSKSLISFKMMLADGEIVECSKFKNSQLFEATCGGMGLTGIIISAKLKLKKINSSTIDQITIRTSCLEETFEAFEEYKDSTYSVAWIDCFAKEKEIGRGLLMIGEHSKKGDLIYVNNKKKLNTSSKVSFLLNKYTVSIFNKLYYTKNVSKISYKKNNIENFFFPLDSITNWNDLYGSKGFVQYQFVLPYNTSSNGLKKILKKISYNKNRAFLGVLKLFGDNNNNWLSFPMKGYTLSLDFKIQKGLFEFLNELDRVVLANGGRIYLTKDARVSKNNFEAGYKKVKDFRTFRRDMNMNKKFNSLQSIRLEL